MEFITGEVTREDFLKARGYFNHLACLLATSLKHQFPGAVEIEVYADMFQIDGEFYGFSPNVNKNIWNAYQLRAAGKPGDFAAFYFTGRRLS